MNPYTTAFFRGMRHGLLGAVHLPVEPAPVPVEVLERLHPDERALAEDMRGFRQVQWVGGRLAAQETAHRLGLQIAPLKSDPFGAPKPSHPAAISIAHKKHLAVALVAHRQHGALGVDLEFTGPPRSEIASRVLTERELQQVNGLVEQRRWTNVLIRFSIKEAIYKALAPRLQRYIAFDEAEVEPDTDGSAVVHMHLRDSPSPVHMSAEYVWIEDSIVATVRARWE